MILDNIALELPPQDINDFKLIILELKFSLAPKYMLCKAALDAE